MVYLLMSLNIATKQASVRKALSTEKLLKCWHTNYTALNTNKDIVYFMEHMIVEEE